MLKKRSNNYTYTRLITPRVLRNYASRGLMNDTPGPSTFLLLCLPLDLAAHSWTCCKHEHVSQHNRLMYSFPVGVLWNRPLKLGTGQPPSLTFLTAFKSDNTNSGILGALKTKTWKLLTLLNWKNAGIVFQCEQVAVEICTIHACSSKRASCPCLSQ